MTRRKLPWWRKVRNEITYRWSDIRHSRRNALAAYSARYILEGLPAERLAEVTGLPEGVIVEAYKNIMEP